MEDNYPASSGLYELILVDTDPKDVYKNLRLITDEIQEENEAEPFGRLFSVLASIETLDDLYPNILETTVIRYNSDGNTVVTFYWNSESDEHLSQYYAFKMQEAMLPEGYVTTRTYTERPDGSTYYEHGLLLAEDFVLSTTEMWCTTLN